MTKALAHRGPDDADLWADETQGVFLGHRRLAVIDLSAAGAQPMASANGRWIIVFNGEIYNHAALRAELDTQGVSPAWRGHSDTEVILAAILHWGIEGTLRRLVGMFAFAVWDRTAKTLTLARDRLGEKPLYYCRAGASFLFASELKALRTHPQFDTRVNRDALALYMRCGYVPGTLSIYASVRKLAPGCFLQLPCATLAQQQEPSQTEYWSLRKIARQGRLNTLRIDEHEAIDEVDRRLRVVVQKQMVADVPVGAFLSGGIDSSTVVALAQAVSTQPVRTYSIGFHESGYDEAAYAAQVARHLGTRHTELYVSARATLDVVPRLAQIYDEPFADPSQISTFLVAQLARQSVTVSLSGDGGDEVFGGYNRYTSATAMWRRIGWLPSSLRAATGKGLEALRPQTWDGVFAALSALKIPGGDHKAAGEKMHKLARILGAPDKASLYEALISQWDDDVVLGASGTDGLQLDRALEGSTLGDFAADMMLADGLEYLPNDILVKLDRAAMAISLEGRIPFLDHDLVEFAWHLPMSMKIRHGQGKWVLRQVLQRYVPAALFERPKMGFGVPLAQWLRGPLRDWAEHLLDESTLRNDGYLDEKIVHARWAEHQSGKRNWHHALWNVLMFQAWLRETSPRRDIA